MGRTKNLHFREYFEGEGKNSKCKVCGMEINATFITNLKRRIKNKHPEIKEKIAKQVAENVEAIELENKKTKFNLEMSAKEVINSCVQFVTEEALPLSFFDSEPFKTLTSQIFDGLKMEKITCRNVMQFVSQKYFNMKYTIKKTLEGKLISLKVDTATCKDRGIMGVNAQLIKNNKMVTISLAMLEIKKKHAAENLKLEISNILNEFDIRKCQVYSITTDNGRNLLKAVQLMSTVEKNDSAEESDIDEEVENVYMLSNIKLENVISIKCAAHTLQLAVKDFLKEINDNIVNKARAIVKVVRTPALMYKLKTANIAKPALDVPTRWSSTYTMLKGLLNAKEFCINEFSSSQRLSMGDWLSIESLLLVLQPAHCLTLKLQSSQLLLTDFYKCWLEFRLEIENMATDMSKIMLKHIQTREKVLIENETVYAALFLDPRLRRLLTKEKIEVAKKHLKQVFVQLDRLQACNESFVSPTCLSEDPEVALNESVLLNVPSLLRTNIRKLEIEDYSSDEEMVTNDNTQRAFKEIDSYKEKRMDIDADLLNYWDTKKYAFPSLRLLAMILLAVPATQASVERAFSALKLVLSDLRCNLSEQNLRAILMLKLNKDLE